MKLKEVGLEIKINLEFQYVSAETSVKETLDPLNGSIHYHHVIKKLKIKQVLIKFHPHHESSVFPKVGGKLPQRKLDTLPQRLWKYLGLEWHF